MMPARHMKSSTTYKDPEAVLAESEQQWLYSEDEIQRSPSVVDGMSPKDEQILRAKGANFILQVGSMVKLPQTTVSAACTLFNRFLMRYSLVSKPGHKALHHYQIAAVVLFVATKVEEHSRKIKELVIACCRVAQKNPVLLVDEQTKDFWRWRDTILLHEDYVLELLCFDLTIESPYNILYEFLKRYGVANNKVLRDVSWAFINDTSMTYMSLLFPSRTIAAAAIYCGAKVANISFPDDKRGNPWWEVQKVEGTEMRKAYNHMATLFSIGILKSDPERVYVRNCTPVEIDESFAKTRLRNEQVPTTTPEPVNVKAWIENNEKNLIENSIENQEPSAKKIKLSDSILKDDFEASGSEEGEVEG